MEAIPKQYNPKDVEDRIYQFWEKSGAFTPEIKEGVKPFAIDIPPPNITGSLHMGHALNNTIIDILIRRARMKGWPTLYLPGTDHAGIATQNVVEKQLAKEGKTRHDLGREAFIKRVWDWVNEYGHIIIDQLKKLGCSCDWSRQRFTMDEDYSEAVKTAFKHYFDKGWIYRGERVINWCIRCQTALSDIELEYKQVAGKLWYLKYPLANSKIQNPNSKQMPNFKSQISNYLTVATTRPETMLGDTAIAVNPNDERYRNWIGQKVTVPLVGRQIPVVADESVDPKFGTGAVKVTPAHDLNDFEIGQRQRLERIKVIDEAGKITENGGPYAGQKSLDARENILKALQDQKLIEKVQDYPHEIPHCYRCGRPVEQLLSQQWFLKMSELIKPAIRAIETDQITFTPPRWKRIYLDWMKNIRDWCISRQIWWGHRLPVFVKKQENLKSQNPNLKINADYYIGDNPPEGYKQVVDVLDTWFSSALWPFATLGWPKNKPTTDNQQTTTDLDYFYPTSILVTARDINMLWVVRMIFSGYEFMKERPFSQVYVHPTVLTIEGKRMSKSLGTGVDPLKLIDKYGADAVRFGLTYINTGTQDIKFDENAILAGQKFANKLWNISRFVMLQIGNSKFEIRNSKQIPNPKSQADKKILEKLKQITQSTDEHLDNFRFGQAAHDLYDFLWHDLADEYIEKSKIQITNSKLKENTQAILLFVLRNSLILLHPIMPFVTEAIWQTLHEQKLIAEKMLISAKWPK